MDRRGCPRRFAAPHRHPAVSAQGVRSRSGRRWLILLSDKYGPPKKTGANTMDLSHHHDRTDAHASPENQQTKSFMSSGRFALFLGIVLSIWAALHLYVLWRLDSVPGVATHLSRRALIVIAAALWAGYPLA